MMPRSGIAEEEQFVDVVIEPPEGKPRVGHHVYVLCAALAHLAVDGDW
jgi:hypothetical protein